MYIGVRPGNLFTNNADDRQPARLLDLVMSAIRQVRGRRQRLTAGVSHARHDASSLFRRVCNNSGFPCSAFRQVEDHGGQPL